MPGIQQEQYEAEFKRFVVFSKQNIKSCDAEFHITVPQSRNPQSLLALF